MDRWHVRVVHDRVADLAGQQARTATIRWRRHSAGATAEGAPLPLHGYYLCANIRRHTSPATRSEQGKQHRRQQSPASGVD
ncbi:hypothetical protein GCM10010452_77080 [Crossiella cryophila]